MKEAIANVGVFNLMIIFLIILMFFFIGSLCYSKAYKVKNHIVNEIEKNGGFNSSDKDEIEGWLSEIGYKITTSPRSCPASYGSDMANSSSYEYCIYELTDSTSDVYSTRYKVIAYAYFDVPIIGGMIRLPVVGETKSITTITEGGNY